jgi:HSP20 family molecular chaperone IbpA
VSSFQGRALRMPENADMEAVSAKYTDGVLEVVIKKKAAEAAPQGKRVRVA